MAELHGYDARVSIGGILYECGRFTIRAMADKGDTNRFGTKYKRNLDLQHGAEVTLEQMTFDTVNNVLGAPIDIAIGDLVEVTIAPDGIANPGKVHIFDELRVLEFSHNGDANGLQPFTLRGETHGAFTLAGYP